MSPAQPEVKTARRPRHPVISPVRPLRNKLFAIATRMTPRNHDSANPYKPTNIGAGASFEHAAPRTKLFAPMLALSAIVLLLPPFPLFFWVADGEPFVGPAQSDDLALVGLSGFVSMMWLAWSALLVYGVVRRWISRSSLALLLLPCFAGGISLLVVYLYGYDQRWFR